MRKMLKKINLLLDRKQKTRMVGLVLIMLIGAILETMGIAMIVPVMKAVVDPEAISAKYLPSVPHDLLHTAGGVSDGRHCCDFCAEGYLSVSLQ